jgi:photoactive yellow protein
MIVSPPNADFETVGLHDLEAMSAAERDALPFGVVGFAADTVVQIYNVTEARMSGLDPATVVGIPFFYGVAQCMNNFMVAQRFEDEPELDDMFPYVLTLRMRPTKVRLRLLATASTSLRYVLIER